MNILINALFVCLLVQKVKMSFMNILKNKIFWLNILVSEVLIHIVYRITYLDNISDHFDVSKNLFNGNSEITQFYIESPTLILLNKFLGISSMDIFLVLLYLILQLAIVLICCNIMFLGEYSTIFLFSGWLVTVSWFVGYVDIISILLLIMITKLLLINDVVYYKLFFLFFLLSFNHYAIALFSLITLSILSDKNQIKKFLIPSCFGFASGYLLITFYLGVINFSGRSRLRFIFNDNVLDDSVNFISDNFLEFIWSGFLGTIFLLIYLSFTNEWKNSIKYYLVLSICVLATSLGLDTTRIFSILLVPLVLYLIKELKESRKENTINSGYILFIVITTSLFFQERFIYGIVNLESPNSDSKSFYDLIPQIVNSIMSNIWS